jgi:hypothetical protein
VSAMRPSPAITKAAIRIREDFVCIVVLLMIRSCA